MNTCLQKIVLMTCLIIGAIGTVALLAWRTHLTDKALSNFKRHFRDSKPYEPIFIENKIGDIFGIAGISNDVIIFYSGDPKKLVKTNLSLRILSNINIPVNDTAAKDYHSFLWNDKIVSASGNDKTVYYANTKGSVLETFKVAKNAFTRITMISPHSFILRGFSERVKRDQIFMKVNVKINQFTFEKNISNWKGDAGISTDGLLLYDSITNLVSYVEYYSGNWLTMDTSLNLLNRYSTIDGFHQNDIKTISKADNSGFSMHNSSPKRLINGYSCVSDGVLYTFSRLRSRSESEIDYSELSTFDSYDILTGKYKSSFYIRHPKGQMIYSFKVYKDILVVVFNSTIAVYKQRSFKNIAITGDSENL